MRAATPPRPSGSRCRQHPHEPAAGPTGSATADAPGHSAVYRRRQPETTPLYPVVQHHLETFLADAAAADAFADGVPRWVEADFRAYLRCGILAHGFARVRCDACAAERIVAFSCKGRAVCPSCNTRRMVELAANLTDHVLPPLPLRQWVFSLPKRLRPFLPHDAPLAGAVLRILLRAIRHALRHASHGAGPDAQLGAISFLHRFGSSLNPHFHFHVAVLDGLFTEEADGSVTFHEATHLSQDDAKRLQRTLQRRVLALFQRRGLLDDHTVADMLEWQAAGGFSLDASVRIHGSDTAGRERLLRYCARPPFALERLRIERHGTAGQAQAGLGAVGDVAGGATAVRQVIYRPPRPTPDGRTVLLLSPLEFLAAIARLIPPPRVHRHRYHGVLAPNARLRAQVVAMGRGEDVSGEGVADAKPAPAAPAAAGTGRAPPESTAPQTGAAKPGQAAARSRWARLIARIYEAFPLLCPDCGGEMRIISFITDPEPVDAILRHIGLPATPPPLSPARGPPQHELDFHVDNAHLLEMDQTPDFDPTEPEPVPDHDFDPA